MLKLLILLLLYVPSIFCFEKTLTVGAIFQNEARFMKEWIDYHRMVGVEEFWLYNNNSTDDYLEVLRPYVEEGVVILIEWPSKQDYNDWRHYTFEVQVGAYNNCIEASKGYSKWLALIDIDEFIVPVKEGNVAVILERDFGDVSGLCLNWVLFGTSGVSEIPDGESMLKSLTMRAPLCYPRNMIYKSIVQPLHVKNCPNPHFCRFLPGHWHVNTNRQMCNEGVSDLCIDVLRINHYWTRDERFFREVKIPRYKKWGSDSEDSLKALHEEKNALSTENDDLILR